MIVLPNLRKETIDGKAVKAIEPDSSITTDACTSHNDFKLLFGEHRSQVIDPKDIGKVLPVLYIIQFSGAYLWYKSRADETLYVWCQAAKPENT